MSVQAITAALAFQECSAPEKLLLLVLANYADEHGMCWPSQTRLSHDTRYTDRGVRKLLASLTERGVISRRPRYKSGSRTSDAITLNLIPEPRSAPPEPRSVHTGTTVTKGAEPRSGYTKREPKKEPSSAREPEPLDSRSRALMAQELRALAAGWKRPA